MCRRAVQIIGKIQAIIFPAVTILLTAIYQENKLIASQYLASLGDQETCIKSNATGPFPAWRHDMEWGGVSIHAGCSSLLNLAKRYTPDQSNRQPDFFRFLNAEATGKPWTLIRPGRPRDGSRPPAWSLGSME